MKPIAVLGASGFVGLRLVEMHHLGGGVPVRPIFYRPTSGALLSRFNLDSRFADYTDPIELAKALEGCDTVVHLAVGNPQIIRQLATPVYAAASRAGLRRMIFMSSASVHGQAPAPGTDESSPLPHRQSFEYNAAKADAENMLRSTRARGQVELVILRPGIVWGPRSRWVVQAVQSIQAGTFGWLNGGQGVINPIYVDNLIHAIDCASSAPVDGKTFLLNDHQPATWREFFEPWLKACGQSPEDVPEARAHQRPGGLLSKFERLRNSATVQKLNPRVPGVLKRALKALVYSLPEPPTQDPFAGLNAGPTGPSLLSDEMTTLQRCSWRFPVVRAQKQLGWEPVVNWPTAVERTVAWLHYANFLPTQD